MTTPARVIADFHALGMIASVGISTHQLISGALHVAVVRSDGSQMLAVIDGDHAKALLAALATSFEKMAEAVGTSH